MGNNLNFEELEKSLNYFFKNPKLLEEALTHKSFTKEYNNERLEFLGDAVLDLIVGEYLFETFPKTAEGNLSKLRASLVNERGFEKLAKLLNLGKFIRISTAEENNDGRNKASILANGFEAVMGAIYLESGLEKVREIVLKLLHKAYPKIDLDSVFKDYKTTLQELTQARYGVIPTYTVVKATGPDHKKEFTVEVSIDDKVIDRAVGKSKKDAQQKVAKKALEKLKDDLS
jgi:ribonuclease-3